MEHNIVDKHTIAIIFIVFFMRV